MRVFEHYRIRALLYAGTPTGSYSPPSHPDETRSAGSPQPLTRHLQTATPRSEEVGAWTSR